MDEHNCVYPPVEPINGIQPGRNPLTCGRLYVPNDQNGVGQEAVFCTWERKRGVIESICFLNGIESEPHIEDNPDLVPFLHKWFDGEGLTQEEVNHANAIISKHLTDHERELGINHD